MANQSGANLNAKTHCFRFENEKTKPKTNVVNPKAKNKYRPKPIVAKPKLKKWTQSLK